MIRTFLILFALTSTIPSMSQTNFSQRVNELFFGVDVSNTSATLLDSLRLVRSLQYHSSGVRQRSLPVSMEMESEKSWSTRVQYTFTESPLPGLSINKGSIELQVGGIDSIEKILDVHWIVEFAEKVSAINFFEQMKNNFTAVASEKKIWTEKGMGDFAEFASRKADDKGVQDVSIILARSGSSKGYQIVVMLKSEFTTD